MTHSIQGLTANSQKSTGSADNGHRLNDSFPYQSTPVASVIGVMTCGSHLSEGFVRDLSDKEIRDEFVSDQIRTRVALLVRALREQPERDWSQTELGRRMGKPQNVVSRLEDPDYGKMSLATLLEVAAAFDLPLWIDMPEWGDWFRKIRDVPATGFKRTSFDAVIKERDDARDVAYKARRSALEEAAGWHDAKAACFRDSANLQNDFGFVEDRQKAFKHDGYAKAIRALANKDEPT